MKNSLLLLILMLLSACDFLQEDNEKSELVGVVIPEHVSEANDLTYNHFISQLKLNAKEAICDERDDGNLWMLIYIAEGKIDHVDFNCVDCDLYKEKLTEIILASKPSDFFDFKNIRKIEALDFYVDLSKLCEK